MRGNTGLERQVFSLVVQVDHKVVSPKCLCTRVSLNELSTVHLHLYSYNMHLYIYMYIWNNFEVWLWISDRIEKNMGADKGVGDVL